MNSRVSGIALAAIAAGPVLDGGGAKNSCKGNGFLRMTRAECDAAKAEAGK